MKRQQNEFKPGNTDLYLQGGVAASFGQDGAFAV